MPDPLLAVRLSDELDLLQAIDIDAELPPSVWIAIGYALNAGINALVLVADADTALEVESTVAAAKRFAEVIKRAFDGYPALQSMLGY